MTSPSHPRLCELQLMLDPGRSELVRAFVREAALSEGVPTACVSRIADDSAAAWLALATATPGDERVHVAVSVSRGEVMAKILLPGHSRFANAVASLGGRLRPDAGISCRECGIDSWEVSLHRSLTDLTEAHHALSEPPAEPAAPPITGDIRIDLPEKGDAPAIARCFLAVYGHHY
ncbi:MAG: hypothetical protein AB7V13_15340, partial [Pseudorhodoplanes sp.]